MLTSYSSHYFIRTLSHPTINGYRAVDNKWEKYSVLQKWRKFEKLAPGLGFYYVSSSLTSQSAAGVVNRLGRSKVLAFFPPCLGELYGWNR